MNKLIIITGEKNSGKTSLIRKLTKQIRRLNTIKRFTTRKKNPNKPYDDEENIFCDEKSFLELVKKGYVLFPYKNEEGHYYGWHLFEALKKENVIIQVRDLMQLTLIEMMMGKKALIIDLREEKNEKLIKQKIIGFIKK